MNIGDRLALLRIFCKFIYTKFISSIIYKGSTLSIPCRDGFTLGVPGGGGVHTPLAPSRWGAGGCYFHDKAEKYERHNEIHVVVMICHTVSEYHV